MHEFFRYDLRTTDAGAAQAFYSAVLGHDRAVIWPLHEQALARGAKPHWLGYLNVPDTELAAQSFLARGAVALGPTRDMNGIGPVAVLRDPGGALLALASRPDTDSKSALDVPLHALQTVDLARAEKNYVELFGWSLGERAEHSVHGSFRPFAWHAGGEPVGTVADIVDRPGVHPQWLYFFAVGSLDHAIGVVRDRGGRALEPFIVPSGARACVCDDPQGAAFGLWQRAGE